MSYEVKVLADSTASGVRLTTLQVTLPRFVLAELNTHRMLSRNSASSRAIPVEKAIAKVRDNPFVPEAFAANQRGMQAGEELEDEANHQARAIWGYGACHAREAAAGLAQIGAHKQWANRPLEPYAWHTVIITATEWANFFSQRCSPDAQPEIRRAAEMMRDAMAASDPAEAKPGDWHMPFIDPSMGDTKWARGERGGPAIALAKVATARCARVSYLTHDGLRDVRSDLALHDRLLKAGHMSPFEHCAQVVADGEAPPFSPQYVAVSDHGQGMATWRMSGYFCGNFRAPWLQYRKMIPGEAVFQEVAK